MNDGPADKLDTLFQMQKELNEYIFEKRDLERPELWDEFMARKAPDGKVRDWVLNFSRALLHEAVELQDSCDWKWWSQDPPIDMQNARVEVIDLWHFLISLSMCVGLKPDDILDVYRQKHAVNRQRQDNGYSRATKDESDNLEIG